MFEISIAEGKNPVGESAERQNPVTIGGVDGDNKIVGLVLNADGSITAKMGAGTEIAGKFIPVDTDGDEKFTAANPASVQLTGSIAHIGQVGYTLKKVSTNFTRPSDTTPYTVGDAITNSTSAPAVFQLDLGALGAVGGQAVEVRKIAVISSAKQAILPLMNIYLSNVTFTATNDNSALDIADEVMNAGGAWFQTDTQNYTVGNSRTSQQNISIPMTLAEADTKLYGILQDAIGYTPASGEVFTIVAWIALL